MNKFTITFVISIFALAWIPFWVYRRNATIDNLSRTDLFVPFWHRLCFAMSLSGIACSCYFITKDFPHTLRAILLTTTAIGSVVSWMLTIAHWCIFYRASEFASLRYSLWHLSIPTERKRLLVCDFDKARSIKEARNIYQRAESLVV